ncbi:MAG: hypothetical protein RLZZ502_345, partial [Pseudomonadota bacterium]|jgi:O-antigen ligase
LANYSANERKKYYTVAWEGIKQAPLLGQGVGQFTPKIMAQFGDLHYRYLHAHSQYLHTAFEMGLFGLTALIAWLWCSWRSPKAHSVYRRHLLLIFAVGTLFNSFLVGASEARFFMALLACYTFLPPTQSDHEH